MFRSAAFATLVVLAGCGQEATVCPAIGWSNGVTVRLADDWPAGDGRTLAVVCPWGEGCVETLAGGSFATTAPLVGGTAVVRFGFATPDSLTLRVGDASGVLTEHQAELEWVRVGGSEECGGPSESDEVVVPAP
jgi:hypothetical protein